MPDVTPKVLELIAVRNSFFLKQKEIYVASATNLNMRYRELLKNDFGTTLVKNCIKDISGEVVRRYFDTSDYYVTVDQLYDRIVNFSYEDTGFGVSDSEIRKSIYNIEDIPMYSAELADMSEQCQKAQTKLFEKETVVSKTGKQYTKYVDSSLIDRGKDGYRSKQREEGNMTDELSGADGHEYRLEVDHIQAAATARYNARYLNTPEAREALKKFFNSPENFQMLEKAANGSKGDVRIYSDGEKLLSADEVKALRRNLKEKYKKSGDESRADREVDKEIAQKYDITYKVSAAQLADAVCERWENSSAKDKLISSGMLGKDGKVSPDVRKKLENNLRQSMNAESITILKNMNFAQTANDALNYTKKSVKKIIAGQVIYYVLPPLVYETQTITKKKGMTLDKFLKEIKKGGKRIVSYATKHLGEALSKIGNNMFSKFLKSFFDIIIGMVKETVKRMVQIAKQLILSLVNCVHIAMDKNSTSAEKGDAIIKLLASSITTIALEVLFEYIEKQFHLPDLLMEPLQLIITVLCLNLVMLVLQKVDLFDVQYGILVANLERAFDEEYQIYTNESALLWQSTEERMLEQMDSIEQHIGEINRSIRTLNLYHDDMQESLNKMNEIFDMHIDFDKEWAEYMTSMAIGV